MRLKMLFESPETKTLLTVEVFDFIHTSELDSYALCWVPANENWLTVPIYTLRPIEKQVLTE